MKVSLRIGCDLENPEMKVIDRQYEWQGFGNGYGKWQSRCRLRIFKRDDRTNLVIVSDLGSDSGTSITNCASEIATKIVQEFDLDPDRMIWVEHYPNSSVEFSQVNFLWRDGTAQTPPIWQYLPQESVMELLPDGCTL